MTIWLACQGKISLRLSRVQWIQRNLGEDGRDWTNYLVGNVFSYSVLVLYSVHQKIEEEVEVDIGLALRNLRYHFL
jgi:hypothetical protein